MIIGLDFDGTWTEDPAFWAAFVQAARRNDHTVIMVTQRGAEWAGDIRASVPEHLHLPIIHSDGRPKDEVARERGYTVGVWIDDNPLSVYHGFSYTGPDQPAPMELHRAGKLILPDDDPLPLHPEMLEENRRRCKVTWGCVFRDGHVGPCRWSNGDG